MHSRPYDILEVGRQAGAPDSWRDREVYDDELWSLQ